MLKKVVFLALSLVTHVLSENNDVIVLVHGLAGSIASFEYRKELEESGLKTIAVEVNPYASNYDRAAELYAQLKGVRTDYGFCHTRSNPGHVQFGPDFTGKGLYPRWNARNPVHFIGHSLGGTTVRTLEKLLEQGSGCFQDRGDLFRGGNNWITSITTLASPMDGTTIFDHVPGGDVLLLEKAIGLANFEQGALDFPMWDLYQQDGETFDDYWERVVEFGLIGQEDFSVFDLRLEGAKKFNENSPQTYPGRYYFSYALERTQPVEECGFLRDCETVEKPDGDMSLVLKLSGRIIGANAELPDRMNDGIVNQNRAKCPGNVNCKMIDDDFVDFQPGVWQVNTIGYLDHFQITARDNRNDNNNFMESAKRIYLRIGVLLQSLPSNGLRTEEELFEVSEKAARVRRYLDAMETLSAPFEEESQSEEVDVVFAVFFVSIFAVGFVGATMIGKKRFKRSKMKATKTKASEDGTVMQATL